MKENRTVYCKIRGALSSHDGNKEFIAFPSGDAQASLVKRVYANHGLSPADTQYVEAHGTGTDAGDRTEMGSICSAMVDGVQGRVPGEKLLVGSVKSNCGHTEGAAGALGVAKVRFVKQELPSTSDVALNQFIIQCLKSIGNGSPTVSHMG